MQVNEHQQVKTSNDQQNRCRTSMVLLLCGLVAGFGCIAVPIPAAAASNPRSQNADASVARTLPSGYSAGQALTVSLAISVSTDVAANSGISLTETPPAGWTVSNISNSGSWDDNNQAVKWLFLPGSSIPATVTYEVTPPGGATGQVSFAGVYDYTVDFTPQQGTITGDTTLDEAADTPTDTPVATATPSNTPTVTRTPTPTGAGTVTPTPPDNVPTLNPRADVNQDGQCDQADLLILMQNWHR